MLRQVALVTLFGIASALNAAVAPATLRAPAVAAVDAAARLPVAPLMNAHHEGPPQTEMFDPIYLVITVAPWAALLAKMAVGA